MTFKLHLNNMGSSPTSADSYTYGTPSTVPTVVSPEHGSNDKGKNAVRIPVEATQDEPGQDHTFGRANRIRVPAPIQIPSGTQQQHLSPTADVFTPGVIRNDHALFPRTPAAANNVGNGVAPRPSGMIERSPVSQLVANSSPDYVVASDYVSASEMREMRDQTEDAYEHLGFIGGSEAADDKPGHMAVDIDQLTPGIQVHEGRYSFAQGCSRTFIVSNFYATPAHIASTFSPDRFPSLIHVDLRYLTYGIFTCKFSDIRDAKQAWALMRNIAPEAEITNLNPALALGGGINSFADVHRPTDTSEGEYVISLTPIGSMQQQPIPVQELVDLFKHTGDLGAVHSIRPKGGATIAMHVEYHDTKAGINAYATLNGIILPQGYRVSVDRYIRTYFTANETPVAIGEPRSAGTGPSRGVPHNPGNNVVDIDRILLGADVRTTIMLRNIPNRLTQAHLKLLLDQTSRGDYDFMYLRIDFANNCNVGYAFVNFNDPMDIVPFVRARAGRRWNVYASDKVAEISYATIQGRDCLIQKFRNSSVMLEKSAFRPKLYYSGAHPNAGEEEPFPGPDNLSKLRRSCENAAHIGLYLQPHVMNFLAQVARPAPYAPINQAPGGVYTAPAPQRQAVMPTPLPPPTSTITAAPTSSITAALSNLSLYAPREGQAVRERQRRQHSVYDRGTPGAQHEAQTFHLTETPPSSAARRYQYGPDAVNYDMDGMPRARGPAIFTPASTPGSYQVGESSGSRSVSNDNAHAAGNTYIRGPPPPYPRPRY